MIGNLSLVALSNGGHYVTVYAIDSLGNASEDTVYFEVAPFPWLLLIAVLVIVIIVVAGGYLFLSAKKANRANPKATCSQFRGKFKRNSRHAI